MSQMRSATAIIVVTLLTLQSLRAQQPVTKNEIRQRIAELAAKAHVALQLTNGNAVRGRIASRAEQDFVLEPDNGSGSQTIAYAQVSSVEQVKERHSKTKWIVRKCSRIP